jgi:uncharacterized membrane protein
VSAAADRAIASARGLLIAGGKFSAFGYWEGRMSRLKSLGLALFAAICLLGETAGSAYAQCAIGPTVEGYTCATEWSGGSVLNLGALPGSIASVANGINDAGQIAGVSYPLIGLTSIATEWSGGNLINLGGLPGFTASRAQGINNAGQAVGVSTVNRIGYATEWKGDSVINLGSLSGFTNSGALSISDAGQAVGMVYNDDDVPHAVEWSGGTAINLGG